MVVDGKKGMEMTLLVKIVLLILLLIAAMILYGILSGQAGDIFTDLLGVL